MLSSAIWIRDRVKMKFNWSEYLDLAKELAGIKNINVSDEAKFRSSISRAYYASYCKLYSYLRDVERDNSLPKGEDAHMGHKYVRDKFLENEEEVHIQIGQNLSRLLTDRIKADYYDNIFIASSISSLSSLAQLDLLYAADIISKLATLRG